MYVYVQINQIQNHKTLLLSTRPNGIIIIHYMIICFSLFFSKLCSYKCGEGGMIAAKKFQKKNIIYGIHFVSLAYSRVHN